MQWLEPAAWQRLLDGVDCPMCGDLHLEANPFSVLVAELEHSYVRLPRNQYRRGWTIVALKRHASELFELSPAELAGFWQEVAAVGRALHRRYQPAKLNYAVFGNLCPHIHCHLVPQFYTDDPSLPLNMQAGQIVLQDQECRRLAGDLRRELGAAGEAVGQPGLRPP